MRDRAQIILLYGIILSILILGVILTLITSYNFEISSNSRTEIFRSSLEKEVSKLCVGLNSNTSLTLEERLQSFNESSREIIEELEKVYGISGILFSINVTPLVDGNYIKGAFVQGKIRNAFSDENFSYFIPAPRLSLSVEYPANISTSEFNITAELRNEGGESLKDIYVGISYDSDNWTIDRSNLLDVTLLPENSSQSFTWNFSSASPSTLNISLLAFGYGEISKIMVKTAALLTVVYTPPAPQPEGALEFVGGWIYSGIFLDIIYFEVRNTGDSQVNIDAMKVIWTPNYNETLEMISVGPRIWIGELQSGDTISITPPLPVSPGQTIIVMFWDFDFEDSFSGKAFTIYFYYTDGGYDIVEFST
jgi:hypothetical protein